MLLQDNDIVLLDARQPGEFQVSNIKGAVFSGCSNVRNLYGGIFECKKQEFQCLILEERKPKKFIPFPKTGLNGS